MDPISHTVGGRRYEIRTRATDLGYEVTTFLDNRRVGPRYTVDFETNAAFRDYHAQPALDMLVAIAKADLDTGTVR